MVMRHCGDCTLCCRVMPMKRGEDTKHPEMVTLFGAPGMLADFDKPAGERCPHQRHTGCAVYAKRPLGCRVWSCRWLVNNDTADLRRPNVSGYVIDMVPDFVRLVPDDGGEPQHVQVVQIWVDPKRRDDWRGDEDLKRYMERRGRQGIAIQLRFNEREALHIFPPGIFDEEWHQRGGEATAERFSTWPTEMING